MQNPPFAMSAGAALTLFRFAMTTIQPGSVRYVFAYFESMGIWLVSSIVWPLGMRRGREYEQGPQI
jgi:hypothetical protein